MSKLLVCRAALGASTLLLLFLTYRITAIDRLEAKIVDARTGNPVAATVVITDGEGKTLEVEGEHRSLMTIPPNYPATGGLGSFRNVSGRIHGDAGDDLYYQYLNAGFHLPIGAGTDKMGEGIPVGSNRLYARFTDAPSYDAWLTGLKGRE